MFRSIKDGIKNYIGKNYTKDVVKEFLKNHKFDDLNQIFQRFDILKYNSKNYKEIKLDNVNTLNDGSIIKCKCDLCTNNNACFQKVSELNKKLISVVNEHNFYYEKISPEELSNTNQNNIIEKKHKHNISHNNEEMFLKNKADQQVNYFSKSKTIFNEESNLEIGFIPNKNQKTISEDNNGYSNNNDPIEQKKSDLEIIYLNGSLENDNIIHKNEEKFIEIKTDIIHKEEKKEEESLKEEINKNESVIKIRRINSKKKKKYLTKLNNKKDGENENKDEKEEKNEEGKSCKKLKRADNNIKKKSESEREIFQNKIKEENLLSGILKECLTGNWKSINKSNEIEIDNSRKNDSKSQDKKERNFNTE